MELFENFFCQNYQLVKCFRGIAIIFFNRRMINEGKLNVCYSYSVLFSQRRAQVSLSVNQEDVWQDSAS